MFSFQRPSNQKSNELFYCLNNTFNIVRLQYNDTIRICLRSLVTGILNIELDVTDPFAVTAAILIARQCFPIRVPTWNNATKELRFFSNNQTIFYDYPVIFLWVQQYYSEITVTIFSETYYQKCFTRWCTFVLK